MESGIKHYSEDAQGRERTIAELEDRIRVLEDELRLKQGQAEDSLQLMRYILDQARDEASLAGPDGRFYYVNDVKCRSLGYTREELLSMHVWDVDSDLTEEKWASVWQDIRDHGFKTFETWHRTKHGQLFRTEVSATYFDFHGREYLCAFVRDITERKRADDALRKSEEKYRELVENANSIILRFDVQGNLTFFNEYAEKLLGYSRGEILGRNVVGTIVPSAESTGRDLKAMIEDIKRNPEHYLSNVNENTCKNGDRVWIAWTNKAIYDEHGNVLEILSVGNDVTELKRAEDALRVSEERLRRSCSAGRIGLYEWSEDWDTVYFSPETYELFGLVPGSTVTYEKFFAIVHPDDREMFLRRSEEAREKAHTVSGISAQNEFRVVHPDGAVIWLLTTAKYALEGGDVMVRGAVRDVTERKRAEMALHEKQEKLEVMAGELGDQNEELRVNCEELQRITRSLEESEEWLRRACSAGRIGLYEWKVDRDHIYFSPEAYELYGLEPGSPVTYEEWFPCVHPEDREMAERRFAENQKNARRTPGISSHIEYRVVHDDGAVLWLEVQSTYALEGGDLTVRGAVRDITERKRAEEALHESERNLARAQAISHIGNWYIDPATDVGSGSDEYFRILGVPGREELSFSEFTRLVHPDDRHMARAYFEETKQMHQQRSFDLRIVRPDGEEHTIHLDGELTIDGEGRPRIFGTMQDITERKRAEEELANAKAQAELYVDLMGHDINNFNQVARGYLELIGGMVEDGELKRLVSKPVEAIDGSSRLIQNVQKLQRARSGEPRLEALDLGALVSEVAGQFKSLSGDMSVNITYDTIKGVQVRANELLRDVLVNLIGNAIKHSAVPAYIDIHMVPEEMGGRRHCRVIIDDNGPGVPDDMKEKIFGRLSRGNTKAKGSGLGLYLVKSLVESYGGKVWAEDKVKGDPTKGARFVVELPVV